MVEETSRRQGFAHRPIEYFYRLYDAFAPEYARLYVMEYEGEVCCCSLVICYGNKVWSVYSGTSDHHREKKATFLMRMEQIRWGLERGCEIYDLMGVPGEVPEDHPLYGLYAVKRGFGGTLTEFTGEMDLVTNRFIYFLAEHGDALFVRFAARSSLPHAQRKNSNNQNRRRSLRRFFSKRRIPLPSFNALTLAHSFLSSHVRPGDVCIDATADADGTPYFCAG